MFTVISKKKLNDLRIENLILKKLNKILIEDIEELEKYSDKIFFKYNESLTRPKKDKKGVFRNKDGKFAKKPSA